MLSKRIRIILIILTLLLLVSSISFAKRKQFDNMKFNLGFGGLVSTGSILGIIESVQIYQSVTNDQDYDYPGLTEEQKDALIELNGAMQRALLVANILGSMEYGIHVRILWKILISEVDLILLPFDGSYNGRIDFMLLPMVGIRCPFFIMPYIMVGPTFTFSFYPEQFTNIENWKGRWAATDNFCFRPGLNIRLGLDFKIKNVSFGGYAQYTVKDFQEFSLWYTELVDAGYEGPIAVGKVVGSQCRVGVNFCIYLF